MCVHVCMYLYLTDIVMWCVCVCVWGGGGLDHCCSMVMPLVHNAKVFGMNNNTVCVESTLAQVGLWVGAYTTTYTIVHGTVGAHAGN